VTTTTWGAPWFLLALALVPVVSWWLRHRRPRLRFSSSSLLQPAPSLRLSLAWVPAPLLAIGLALCIVALARPQLPHTQSVTKSEGIDIMLALDTSRSMAEPDFTIGGRRASRLDVAKNVVARFVAGREHDRVGLVVFGEEAFTQVPLTLDHQGLSRFLRQVDIGMAGERRTAIGDAVAVATRRMAELEAPSKVVILLTDGQSNAGQLEPDDAAEAAAALGVKVYTIGVGPEAGGRRRSRAGDLDEAALRRIAEITDAHYFRATDEDTLTLVYQTIDELEPTTAEVRELTRYEERYHRWLAWGLALLVLGVLLDSTLLRRIP
jgi:Ca-activated chloride channel family protein